MAAEILGMNEIASVYSEELRGLRKKKLTFITWSKKQRQCRSRDENVREGGIQKEVVLEKPAKEQKVHHVKHCRQINNSNSTLRFHNRFTRSIAREKI